MDYLEDKTIFSTSVIRNYSADAHSSIIEGLAQANTLGLTIFGTEALLLGLSAHEQGKAAKILSEFVDLNTLRQQISKINTLSEPKLGKVVELPFSRRCSRILKTGVHAVALNPSQITTTDLLLAILAEPESGAVQILNALKVSFERIRIRISERY